MANKAKRLTGIHPLSYMGVDPVTPPQLVVETRAPTITDVKGFEIGALWIVTNPQQVWTLVNVTGASADWVELYPGAGGGATSFPTDSGTASEVGGVLNILGDSNITTIGAGDTVYVTLGEGLNGQVLVGGNGVDASWETITSTGGTIAITGGSNTLNLETVGGQGLDNMPTDVGTASPTGAGDLTLAGGELINTTGVLDVATVNLDRGSDGEIIIGRTGSAAGYANITSTGASITITNGPNSINLETAGVAGNVSFLAYQNPALSDLMCINSVISYIGAATALTEAFDTGGDFTVGDGAGTPAIFTAPVTGVYQFNMMVSNNRPSNVSTGQDPKLVFKSTAADYALNTNSALLASANGRSAASILLDMTIGDTCQFGVQVFYGTTPGIKLIGISGGVRHTSISGFLVG